MTSLQIKQGEYRSHRTADFIALLDSSGSVALEYHNRALIQSMRHVENFPELIHKALHDYGLREGLLVQDGDTFRAKYR